MPATQGNSPQESCLETCYYGPSPRVPQLLTSTPLVAPATGTQLLPACLSHNISHWAPSECKSILLCPQPTALPPEENLSHLNKASAPKL